MPALQSDGGTWDYRGFNIAKEVMLDLAGEITGERTLPGFSPNVVLDEEAAYYLRSLHELVLKGSCEFDKEESLLLLVSLLIQRYGRPYESCVPECREEIERACAFIEAHYAQRICLDQICRCAGSEQIDPASGLYQIQGRYPLQLFGKCPHWKGKKTAGAGGDAVEAALQTGFSDQSHFTNYFNRFIGLGSRRLPGDIFEKRRHRGEDTWRIKRRQGICWLC